MTSAKNGRVQTPPPPCQLNSEIGLHPSPLVRKIRNRLTLPPPFVRNKILMYHFLKENTLLKKSYAYENYLDIWKEIKKIRKIQVKTKKMVKTCHI